MAQNTFCLHSKLALRFTENVRDYFCFLTSFDISYMMSRNYANSGADSKQLKT